MKVITYSPGKLMLLGEHAVVYDRPCIAFSINKGIRVEVERSEDLLVKLPSVGLKDWTKLNLDKPLKGTEFIVEVFKEFKNRYNIDKVKIVSHSDLDFKLGSKKGSYGLGGSSAITVATALALKELFQINLKQEDIFNICYKVVRKLQGGSGFDIACSLYGGFILYRKKRVERIKAKEPPLLVCWSGIDADTKDMVKSVYKKLKEEKEYYEEIMDDIAKLVLKGKEALLKGDWVNLGDIMDKNQRLLRILGVSSARLEVLIEASKRAGALGSKISGAGGGDNIIALSYKREKIIEAWKRVKGYPLDLKPSEEGAKVLS
ncbi:Phosphomevalonate kinase [archaeon HR06]|nr:Phosphomevalonate kinase [archaeon HR06]